MADKIRTFAQIVDIGKKKEVMEIVADVSEFEYNDVSIRQSSDIIEIICDLDNETTVQKVQTPEQIDELARGEYNNGILTVTLKIKPHDRSRWDLPVTIGQTSQMDNDNKNNDTDSPQFHSDWRNRNNDD